MVMTMSKPELIVEVITALSDGHPQRYSATDARVNRHGDLILYRGWRQVIFHPSNEWISYAVKRQT